MKRQRSAQKLLLPCMLLLMITCLLSACAKQPITDPGSSSSTTTPASTSSGTTPTDPFVAIRMIDNHHGWAMTKTTVYTTADGGSHWSNISPISGTITQYSRGAFRDAQQAWIATPQNSSDNILVWRTTDGGQHWASTTITTDYNAFVDMPHFISNTEGWLAGSAGGAAGSAHIAVFHTTDSGAHWTQVSPNSDPNGHDAIARTYAISVKDQHNIWETGAPGAGVEDQATPVIGVSNDGGHTWHQQTLTAIPGAASDSETQTTPPVFFGSDAILPINNTHSGTSSVNLYVSHNGGTSWTPTHTQALTGIGGEGPAEVYTLNPQHTWILAGHNVYATADGGQHWSIVSTVPQNFSHVSFINDNEGWAITSDGSPFLTHTTDGGHTWHQITYTII